MSSCKHTLQIIISPEPFVRLQFCRDCKKILAKWPSYGEKDLKVNEKDSESVACYLKGIRNRK